MAANLERNSWEPLYYQISERLREKIDSQLSPGDQIPSEYELMAEYNVSRNTVRLALDALTKQGLVHRVKGKGTFVTGERLQYGLFRLASFSEEMENRGYRPSSHLLRLRRMTATPKIARLLQLQPADEVFLIERLRLANGQPLALNVSYHPVRLCPTLDQEDLVNGSIYQLIEQKYNFLIAYANQTLKPTIASDYEAELLQVKSGSALLLVEGVAYLVDNTPIEYAQLYYRGDRYEFPIQAVRRPISPSREVL